jgi:hypothetical protein
MKRSLIARRAGLLVLAVTLDAAIIQSSAFSQSLSNQKAGPDASISSSAQGSTLTGGAEGAPTDQATPAPSSNTGMPSSVSGGSNTKGNTLTGGAEGAPTSQATPSPATGTTPTGPASRPGDPPPNMKASQSE